MAQKKRSGKTQTNTKNSGRGRQTAASRPQSQAGGFRFEIVLILAFAVAVFLEISNFGLCGTLGDAISGFLFGVFGWIQYILPMLVFIGMAFLFANGYSGIAIKKTVYAGILCLDIAILTQLIMGFAEQDAVRDLYLHAYAEKTGGGFVGGGLALLLKSIIGVAGTWLFVIVLALIMIILLTERSFIRLLQNGGSRLMDDFRDAKERGQEYQEQRQEERMTLDEIRAAKQAEREAARLQRKEKAKNELDRRRELQERERAKAQLERDAASQQQEPEYNRFHQKVKKGLFRNLTVLPGDGEQGVIKNDEFKKENPLSREEVHEITMVIDHEKSDGLAQEMTAHTQSPHAATAGKEQKNLPVTEAAMSIAEEDDLLTANEKPVRKRRVQKTRQSARETQEEVKEVAQEAGQPAKETRTSVRADGSDSYEFPPYDLLKRGTGDNKNNQRYIEETKQKLQSTLDSFGVRAAITDYSCGPSVTRFELQPEQGVKVSKIVGLADDIKLNLAASDIRIEAPIPGKAAVGIEIPNKENVGVMFRDLIEDNSFVKFPSDIAFAVGKDISGQVVVADIAKMPHLLIAGATGSGKSVCINTIIMSILFKATPEDVKLIMIDPKVVELTVYNGIPHLLIPVVTDPKKAAGALNWAVMEMTKRYQLFAEYNVRNLKGYNKKVEEAREQSQTTESTLTKLPQIVVIVDELADLMMVAHGEVEDAIVRLSQLARAAGIHLVIATQRPSVDVITGLIKANVPSRIAFAVSSLVDSRTILDMSGAEKLLGKGDMLFYPTGFPKPVRVQGAFVSDEEVGAVVEFLKKQSQDAVYDPEITSQIESSAVASSTSQDTGGDADRDEYFRDAARLIIESDKASIGMLQRKFKIGFNRAARIMDQLAEAGIVGPDEGTKPRTILMSPEQFEEYADEYL